MINFKKYKIYGLLAFLGTLAYKVWKSGYNHHKNKTRKKNDKIKKKINRSTSNIPKSTSNKLRKKYNRRD